MIDEGVSDSASPSGLNGMHRFQLGMRPVELLERPDPEDLSVEPCTEEGDVRVEQTLDIQGMNTASRCDLSRELQMTFQHRPNIVTTRIVNRNHKVHESRLATGAHRCNLAVFRRCCPTCRPTRESNRLRVVPTRADDGQRLRFLIGAIRT